MIDNFVFKNKRIFEIFEEISAIPHGSGNMTAISNYVVDFAKRNELKFVTDSAKNVIIYKPASKGYENSEPIILKIVKIKPTPMMVCQNF